MNNNIQSRRLVILNDTVQWFSNHPRAKQDRTNMMRSKGCLYFKDSDTGCSIGRLITDKELCRKLDEFAMSGVLAPDIFELLPPNLKELGQLFLYQLQALHDNDDNWLNGSNTNNKLSDKGNELYESIKREFCV